MLPHLQLHISPLCRSCQLPLLLTRQPCDLLSRLHQQVAHILLCRPLLSKPTGSQAEAPAEGTLQLL
jgi:hypothetical protein